MAGEPFVLLVEDNADDVELALLAFQQEAFPYKIMVARDGQQALDFLFGAGEYAGRDRNETPLLVILDIKMPRVGGLEVLRAMRGDPRLSEVKAVVLTSSDEERDRAEAEDLGAFLYLRKPMSFLGLREIVGRLKASLG